MSEIERPEKKLEIAANIGRTLCVNCNAITLIPGWDWCERCASEFGRMIPVSVIADAIMTFDIDGVLPADREAFWKMQGVTKHQLAAAEEECEIRHKALGKKRNRYRGWN